MSTQSEQFQQGIDEGKSILEVARYFVVTEPFVRKTLGIPNPDLVDCAEWNRCQHNSYLRYLITEEIYKLYEPKFITPEHTAQFIEAMITMTDSKQILELGMYSGFTTLHMIRAIVGKPGAKVVSVDARPAHDSAFFSTPELAPWFEFVNGWTPQCLSELHGRVFDLVFVDSSHGCDHCELELIALQPITRTGTVILFHDVPKEPSSVYDWLIEKVSMGQLLGTVFPTAPQLDIDRQFGPVNNEIFRPNLGVFIRP